MFNCFDLCVFSFFRKPIEELELLSCTEGTCKWKSKLGTLNNYEPQPVANSKCFKTLQKKTANINVEFVHNVAKEMLPRSWNLHREKFVIVYEILFITIEIVGKEETTSAVVHSLPLLQSVTTRPNLEVIDAHGGVRSL
jgi:hypothetical protein